MVDPALDPEIATKGYVKVELLGPGELEVLREGFAQLRPADGWAPEGTGLNRSTYHCTFLDEDTDYKRRASQLVHEVFGPALRRVIADHEILTSNFYVKPAGTGRFQIHQNWPTTQDLSLTTLTVWCPLHDVDELGGTLQVVPGSHKVVPDIAAPTDEPFFGDIEDELIAHHLVPMPLRAGEALIFDDGLIHWSPENQREEPRRAVQIEMVPCGVTPILYHLDRTGPEPRWELLAVDEEFFIEHSITEVIDRPGHLEAVGHAPYVNRKLSVDELVSLLGRGDEIRAHVYEHGTWPEPVAEPATVTLDVVPGPGPGPESGDLAAPEPEPPLAGPRRSRWARLLGR